MSAASAPAPADLRDLAVALAREGAGLARDMRRGGIEVADTKTSAVDVVTEADRAVEDLLRRRIAEHRPDDAVLGEEGDDRAGTSGVRWIVDPIDGTVNYLYGLADCAVSVAVEVDGDVVAGAVVAIWSGVTYAAAAGEGSTRDGVSLRVRPVPPLAERLVVTGFGYQREVREHQARASPRCSPRCATSVAWARARWTCATSPRAPRTATSRRGRRRGTTPRAGSCCARPADASASSAVVTPLRVSPATSSSSAARTPAGTTSSRR